LGYPIMRGSHDGGRERLHMTLAEYWLQQASMPLPGNAFGGQ
jgi:hypothetical protein